MADRYLRIVLTVIAIELGWIGLKGTATPVQAQAGVSRVVITGIEVASVPVRSASPLKVEADRPLRVDVNGPVKVEADKPLPVETVRYTPAPRPGE